MSEEERERLSQELRGELALPLVVPAMPIRDAIDLAVFLTEVTIGCSRFQPGPPTAGGEVEVAAITKHEGFKWVRRKHDYEAGMNPEGGG